MDSEILVRAKANLANALQNEELTQIPNAGWRWQAYRTATLRFVNYFRTPIEVIHAIQSPRSNMGYEARMTGRGLIDYARAGERANLQIFPQYAHLFGSFTESPLSHPDTLAYLNNRLVSSPMLSHMVHIMRCVSMVQPEIVLEIGGGYGAPSRLWMTNGLCRPRIYIDVDFPESLFFSEVYLKANDPSLRVEYLKSSTDLQQILKDSADVPTVILAPITLIDLLKSLPIDLVINTGSLQEMTEEFVDFYCRWLDQGNVEHFYSSNYFGQQIDNLYEGMNYVAPNLSDRWITKFCNLHEDPLRPVAEMLFGRIQEESIHTQREQAHSKCLTLLNESEDPIALRTFLNLFDLSRFITDTSLLEQICDRALRMTAVPKEALPLAKRLLEILKINQEESERKEKVSAMTESLIRMAEAGKSSMGIVDPTVERFKDVLMHDKTGAFAISGYLVETTYGTEIELTQSVRTVRHGTYGAVERKEFNQNQMTISGWARSERYECGDSIVAVHVFIDGRLVESVEPDIRREEFGTEPILCGFEIRSILPMDQADCKHCFVIAEFKDKTVGKLANGGDI